MPSLIHYENWDGVSAPALPSNWGFSVGTPLATTASPTGGISPLSSPNVLACDVAGNDTHWPAIYQTPDGNGGNVLVYASFNAAATTANQTYGLLARVSGTAIDGGTSYYWAQLTPDRIGFANPAHVLLYAVVAGTQTLLASVQSVTVSTDEWYQLQLSCQNSTIAVTLTRASDGYNLNSSGTWQAGATTAISVSDSSVTGSGCAGLTLQSHSDNAYTDEWYFYGYSGSPQAGPVRALPIVQRARSRGQVIQPLAVRFGTPVVPPAGGLRSGIVCRDASRRIHAVNRGSVWLSTPPQFGVPAPIPFAFWNTIRWVDPSETRRRAAPGKAATPQTFARLPIPPVIAASNWRTIWSLDPSPLRRRMAPGRAWCPGAAIVPGSQVYEGWTQQYITSVNPPVQYGTELFLSWTSDIPAGSDLVYQVYENDVLVWHGTSPYCTLPLPSYVVRFDIGTVGFTQATIDFSSLVPPAPLLQAELSWLGGTFEAADIAGFHVYREEAPGSGIDYSEVLGTIAAYTANVVTDGFGYGGFGEGGWGEAAGSYSWTSGALSSGVWHFAVIPFDTNGNEGTGSTVAVLIQAPPQEPAPFSNRSRLQYTWNPSDYEITLNWNASPG
ncbi:MAG: hypothetical protein ACLQIB_04410 [Isosphaeraceae bacterium]